MLGASAGRLGGRLVIACEAAAMLFGLKLSGEQLHTALMHGAYSPLPIDVCNTFILSKRVVRTSQGLTLGSVITGRPTMGRALIKVSP